MPKIAVNSDYDELDAEVRVKKQIPRRLPFEELQKREKTKRIRESLDVDGGE